MAREIKLTDDFVTAYGPQLRGTLNELDRITPFLEASLGEKNRDLLLAQALKAQKVTEPLVAEARRATDDQLVDRLRDENPLVRWLAADVLSRRQAHAEKELIPLLKDPYPEVRDAVRQALVRLSRGNDFGPKRLDTKANMETAVERWTRWLTLQDTASPDPAGKAPAEAPRPEKRK